MAKRQSKVKAEEVNEIVTEGGHLYLLEVSLIQKNYFSVIHSEEVRYKNELKTLISYDVDANDENKLSVLAHHYTKL